MARRAALTCTGQHQLTPANTRLNERQREVHRRIAQGERPVTSRDPILGAGQRSDVSVQLHGPATHDPLALVGEEVRSDASKPGVHDDGSECGVVGSGVRCPRLLRA
jgi:hypothetical protein